MPFYVPVGPRGLLFRVGMISTGLMGSLSYWWTNRRRPAIAMPHASPRVMTDGQSLDDSSVRRT
jgi:hypothetical protein